MIEDHETGPAHRRAHVIHPSEDQDHLSSLLPLIFLILLSILPHKPHPQTARPISQLIRHALREF